MPSYRESEKICPIPLFVRITQKDASWFAPDLAEFLTSFSNGRGINNRQRLLDIVSDERIKQRLVRILKIAHEGVFFERRWKLFEALAAALPLLFDGANMRRQETMQGKCVSLAFGKAVPLLSLELLSRSYPARLVLITPFLCICRVFIRFLSLVKVRITWFRAV